jgi:hypothetical protein
MLSSLVDLGCIVTYLCFVDVNLLSQLYIYIFNVLNFRLVGVDLGLVDSDILTKVVNFSVNSLNLEFILLSLCLIDCRLL